VCSNRFNYAYPDTELRGHSEFDALFVREIETGIV
jgi:hypothetical protein